MSKPLTSSTRAAPRLSLHELFQPLIMNEHIQKVFHGHEDEVTLLSYEFSIEVPHTQIFDTRTGTGDRLCLAESP